MTRRRSADERPYFNEQRRRSLRPAWWAPPFYSTKINVRRSSVGGAHIVRVSTEPGVFLGTTSFRLELTKQSTRSLPRNGQDPSGRFFKITTSIFAPANLPLRRDLLRMREIEIFFQEVALPPGGRRGCRAATGRARAKRAFFFVISLTGRGGSPLAN
ncbi:hypothetical protein EVAR_64058_1 [Eumeta japonica]|uniref:Uncharacterized protein n=1 Tax=Eumeta variegata TaxID=151549 RepID=A0A4C1ZZ39_EUMVA|nr:hypothetical protein EVAR_64058_1 [Eumeta japonica]